ncbi:MULTISPECIES: DUF3311 domain-containing protein [unclassified Lysinibacillus]|uniref:DUF3311 domain-containing protein n=1 Tax=unclassified Lysinibacillus TaxID=2636778 RepID=UPI0038154B29
MSAKTFFNVFIGLVLPVVSVIAGLIYFRYSEHFILGFPILYFWMFLWFILTSICISCSWFFFDKKNYD